MSAPKVGDEVTVNGEQCEVLEITESPTGPVYRVLRPRGSQVLASTDQIEGEPETEPAADEAEAEAKVKAEAEEAEEKAREEAEAKAKEEAEEKARLEAAGDENPPE